MAIRGFNKSVRNASYWEYYYNNPVKDYNNNNNVIFGRIKKRTLLILSVIILILLYFGISSTLAYWSLQKYHQQQQQEQQQQGPFMFHHHHQHHQQQPPSSKVIDPSSQLRLFDSSAIIEFLERLRRRRRRNKNDAAYDDDNKLWYFVHRPITAYLEAPLKDVIPNTESRGDLSRMRDIGTPPTFIQPLPLRTQSPRDLQKVIYPQVRSCLDMPAKFPIDAGLQFDSQGNLLVTNVGEESVISPHWKQEELPYCPVNTDPFLPWIHDVFPSIDGQVIHIIAQNKRLCHTGIHDTDFVHFMTPQVALMQPVSVQVISQNQARTIAPQLWSKPPPQQQDSNVVQQQRYQLLPRNQITKGHNYTRFICRFTTRNFDNDNDDDDSNEESSTIISLGETLSEYEFNYEYASYRKENSALLTPKGKDTNLFWTSNIRFTCPVPHRNNYYNAQQTPINLPEKIATGQVVFDDERYGEGLPLLFLDIIPIRTSVRYQQHYLGEEMIGPPSDWVVPGMDPVQAWGPHGHVLPHIEASGRWTNIPICLPPLLVTPQHPQGQLVPQLLLKTATTTAKVPPNHSIPQDSAPPALPKDAVIVPKTTKPHFLSACLWTSIEFRTRGVKKGSTTDTLERLVEWLEFHRLVGFDHIYVYDNSGAHTNRSNLEGILKPYMDMGFVTRIDWPSQICNNNIPAADSPGERSSQYAAENSCRTRYAPFTEWLISFDTDEYLVPMGQDHLPTILQRAWEETGAKILSFRSSRGKLREDCSLMKGNRRYLKPNTTFLEAYNCDSAGIPKPEWADRARKQVYLSDYVLYHFVHYSTVTQAYLTTYAQHQQKGIPYRSAFREHAPTERATNELTEAVMVHTKTVKPDMTLGYQNVCHYQRAKKWQTCWIGFPFPVVNNNNNNNSNHSSSNHRSDGMEYNCYENESLQQIWIPKLRQALAERRLSHPELFSTPS